ncbi:MAG: nuclear transport factor 2 family protein [Acidobacteria bacterium]|nr:nuclear transport factor 2 family protein [Acidobacteriota bacterium]
MGRWSRDELEEAFANYQRVALQAGTSGDWNDWADMFTEDATYKEHLYGEMGGREAIRRWITKTMAEYPNNEMHFFPIEWYIIDEERGWVVCQVWNRMADPGDGSLHQEYNFTLLKYAGDNRWSYEEDIYNPHGFGTMVEGYLATKQALSTE